MVMIYYCNTKNKYYNIYLYPTFTEDDVIGDADHIPADNNNVQGRLAYLQYLSEIFIYIV